MYAIGIHAKSCLLLLFTQKVQEQEEQDD